MRLFDEREKLRNDARLFPVLLSAAALICSFWSEHDLARPSPKSAQLPFGASIGLPSPTFPLEKKKKTLNAEPVWKHLKWTKESGAIGNELHYCLSVRDFTFFRLRTDQQRTQFRYIKFWFCKWFKGFARNPGRQKGVLFTYITNTSHSRYSRLTFTWIKHFWRHVTHRQPRMRLHLRLEIPPPVLWMRAVCEVQMKFFCAACAFCL